jgi:hypothetical protein
MLSAVGEIHRSLSTGPKSPAVIITTDLNTEADPYEGKISCMIIMINFIYFFILLLLSFFNSLLIIYILPISIFISLSGYKKLSIKVAVGFK